MYFYAGFTGACPTNGEELKYDQMRKLKLAELNRLSTAEFRQADKLPVIVVLDNVRSAMNIGSIFRTADAFRLEAIYLVGITATPPNRDILKTALGATETVAWAYFKTPEACLAKLREQDTELLCVEQSDRSVLLQDFESATERTCALVFGNEVEGVSDAFMRACDACIEVPQWGMKHSLNVAVCAGIVLWELVKPKPSRFQKP